METRVKAVPNGMQKRGAGVRGINPFWSLQVVGTETFVRKGWFGRISFVPKQRATKWTDVGKMVVWARDKRADLQIVT